MWYSLKEKLRHALTMKTELNCISKPSSLKVSSRNTTSLKLYWEKASGVNGYQLQQKSGNRWKTIANTTLTSYTVKSLKSNTTYNFRVRAYKKVNGVKYYSVWVSLSTPTKPTSVNFSSIASGKGGFIAKWKKVACSGYQIQYSNSSEFKGAKTVNVNSKTTSKTVTKLKGKKKYYVRIRAYKTVKNVKYYGAWSKSKSVTTKK